MSRILRLGAVALLALAPLTPALAEEVAQLAVLIKTVGPVEHQAHGAEGWASARQGQVLASGDKLRTGPGGAAALLFVSDRSLLKLDAETEVALRGDRESGTVSTRLWMGAGDLWAKVTRGESPHFQVETPTSVASVKGSEFYCLEDATGGNLFHALTGEYRYGNGQGMIELTAGMTGSSDGESLPRSRPTEPGELPGFGGVEGYGVEEGGEGRTVRIEFENENGERRTLVIPLDRTE